jgi:hypothetical protein
MVSLSGFWLLLWLLLSWLRFSLSGLFVLDGLFIRLWLLVMVMLSVLRLISPWFVCTCLVSVLVLVQSTSLLLFGVVVIVGLLLFLSTSGR